MQPHAVYIDELFFYAYFGRYSPYFSDLASKDPMSIEYRMHAAVLAAQKDFDLLTRGEHYDTATGEFFSDASCLIHKRAFSLDPEREALRSAQARMQAMMDSPTIVPLFMSLLKESHAGEDVAKMLSEIEAYEESRAELEALKKKWADEIAIEKGVSIDDPSVRAEVDTRAAVYAADKVREHLDAGAKARKTITDLFEEDDDIRERYKAYKARPLVSTCSPSSSPVAEKRKETDKAVDRELDKKPEEMSEGMKKLMNAVQDWLDKKRRAMPREDEEEINPGEIKEMIKALLEAKNRKALEDKHDMPDESKVELSPPEGEKSSLTEELLKMLLSEEEGEHVDTKGRASDGGVRDEALRAIQEKMKEGLDEAHKSIYEQPKGSGTAEGREGEGDEHDAEGSEKGDSTTGGEHDSEGREKGDSTTGDEEAGEEGTSGAGEKEDGTVGDRGAGKEGDDSETGSASSGRSPKDGDISAAIKEALKRNEVARKERLAKEAEKVKGEKGEASGSAEGEGDGEVGTSDTGEATSGESKPGTEEGDREARAGESMAEKLRKERAAFEDDAYASLSESEQRRVREALDAVNQPARKYGQKLRKRLLGQMEQEMEYMGRAGGKFSLMDYIRLRQKFFIKKIFVEKVETIDVEILVDLSGSLAGAAHSIASLALYMSKELGDLGDIGINFQIRGLDENGIVVNYRPWGRPGQKVMEKELHAIFTKMTSGPDAIGYHGAEEFTTALNQSREDFKQRKSKSKHKVIFLISDGQDGCYYGGASYEKRGMHHVSGNPGFTKALKGCFDDGINVIGVGAATNRRESAPIDMFAEEYGAAHINIGSEYDLIGETIMQVLLYIVQGKGAKRKLRGDLYKLFKTIGSDARSAHATRPGFGTRLMVTDVLTKFSEGLLGRAHAASLLSPYFKDPHAFMTRFCDRGMDISFMDIPSESTTIAEESLYHRCA